MDKVNLISQVWKSFLHSVGESIETTDKTFTSWHFEVTERGANSLLDLVIAGKKKATASSPWVFEYDNEPLPKVGDYSIITNWDGIPKAIIRTKNIEILPFKEVTETFAAKEGEGDQSLDFWRKAHKDYFTYECLRIGKQFTEDIPVLCEEFDLVFIVDDVTIDNSSEAIV
ncbi:ASCH domain-containing protein [Acetivibrio cellulolyticus]|uniref:ASCH domain-containing protein n=1 Tax=Acetivibrio cellulolyticus TaxID=35830 RepID=UPI0001E2C6AB|nr:ASCH domain-containing protein [Acetivibrio cellulolyticus]